MRLDRIVTLGVVGPALRAASLLAPDRSAPPRRRRLPILMYHSVSPDPEPGIAAYFRTAVSRERFTGQMRLLHRAGWRVVSVRDAIKAAANQAWEKLAVLTFDDGFRDFHTTAWPVLRKFGFGATIFLPTGFISEGGGRRRFRDREVLAWPEVEELHRGGIEIGSHTVRHPQLNALPWAEVESELVLSKSAIEARLGASATSFSYPFAFPQADEPFCERLRDSLRRAGYEACVTTEIGCASAGDDLLRLKRLPVNEADDDAFFAAKLGGAYDWLAGPQRACKRMQHARACQPQEAR